MTSFYEKFKTDKKAEAQDGIWLDYGAAGRIRIHRAGGANQRFSELAKARLKPYTRQMQMGTLDPKLSQDIMIGMYADAVIVEWDGVKGESGELLEFNRENVVKLLTDLPDLFGDIQTAAQDHSLFLASVQEEISGNSQPPYDGTYDSATQ